MGPMARLRPRGIAVLVAFLLSVWAGAAPALAAHPHKRTLHCTKAARAHGKEAAHQLQRWLVESDVATDPQAFIISPETSIELAKTIVAADSHYHAGVAVARKAVELLRDAHTGEHGAHQIVEIVRNPAGERSDRFHLLRLRERFATEGVELNTRDVNAGREVEFELHLNARRSVAHPLSYAYLYEDPIVRPINGNLVELARYRKLFTSNEELVVLNAEPDPAERVGRPFAWG